MRRYHAVAALLVLLVPFFAHSAQAETTPPFLRRWNRDDAFVAGGDDNHSWTWGPLVLRSGVEPYLQSPQGRREVWYFDKGRMEITNPDLNPGDAWYVTSGLLVRELISGEMQTGDGVYETWQPATVPVAGDLEAPLDRAITYADLRPLATIHGEMRAEPRSAEQPPLTDAIAPGGTVQPDDHFASYDVRTEAYDETTGHNIPSVFLDALTPETLLYIAGRPLTEPYWTRVLIAHEERDVLLQAFERRVLTYTPSNPVGWRVEWGNTGRQYAQWRYGNASDGMPFEPHDITRSADGPRALRQLSPAAANIARDRRGYVGVAVYDLDSAAFYSFQGTRTFPMYSVAKFPIMLAALDRAVREDRRVTMREQSLIESMMQVSDNNAATILYADLGGAAPVQTYLRRIGINNTTMNEEAWGYSTTTVQDLARMMVKLGNCTILVDRLCRYGLDVMQNVVRYQAWGVSAGLPDSATVALKNGWYPGGDGWAINSVGLITTSERRYAIAVMTNPNPSQNYGIETIEQIATEVYGAMR